MELDLRTMKDKKKPRKDPNSAKKTYSTWMGFATREMTSRGSVRIHIRWGRVAALVVGLFALLWVGKSVALYYFFKNLRDFEDVAIVDMFVFPINRSNVRVQQGDYQVDQAKAALQREDYRRAYALLREGVARSPSNLEGRMILAQMYAGWRPDLAAELMVSGIEYGLEDRDYVKLMCSILLREKEDQQILELTERLLAMEPPEQVKQVLYVTRLQASILLGRFGIARDIYETTDIENTLDGLILGTNLFMKVDREDRATRILQSVINSMPDESLDPIYNQLVRVYMQREMWDRAREAALEVVIRNPMDWRPRINLIDILSASERTDRRDREIEALLQQHRDSEQAMSALAQLCAKYGNVRAASRLYEVALENGYSLGLFSLTLAEAYMNDGDFNQAIELCNELVREDPSWLLNAESSFNAVRSLAYFNVGDTELGNLYLKNFLDARRTKVGQLFQAAKSFRKYDLDQEAMRILEEAYKRDPGNENVLAVLVDVEMDQGAYFSIDEHLQALFKLRRPDYAILERIHLRLHSDRFLFTQDRVALLEQLDNILREKEVARWNIWVKEKPTET